MIMRALLWITVTVAFYAASRAIYRRWPIAFLSPIVIVPVLLVLSLLATHTPYQGYMRGGRWLVGLLSPAIVAFGLPLYQHRALLRRYAVEMGVAVGIGSAVAVGSSIALARWLGLDDNMTMSVAPRSVTTPFAMLVAGQLGGSPELAAVCVIITAVVGVVVGPLIIRFLRLRSAAARGALFGMGAHAAGTARAMEYGALEGTTSALVMIAAALLLLLTTPALRWLIQR